MSRKKQLKMSKVGLEPFRAVQSITEICISGDRPRTSRNWMAGKRNDSS